MITKATIKISEFRLKDTDQVIDVITKVLKSLALVSESEERITDEDLYQITKVYRGKGRFWVAVDSSSVIGTVAIRDLGKGVAKLNRMFVLPKYHGSGVGQKLLDTAIAFAREQKYDQIILNTNVLMKRAHHFYEKNGFIRFDADQEEYHYRLKL